VSYKSIKAGECIETSIISPRVLGSGFVLVINGILTGVFVIVSLTVSKTDFVSKNEEFQALAKDIAMQVAATNPTYLRREDISEADREQVRETFKPEVEGKPEEMKEKILTGKVDAFFAEKVLLEQPFIKNPDHKIQDLINGAVQKFGERTEIRRFARFAVSE